MGTDGTAPREHATATYIVHDRRAVIFKQVAKLLDENGVLLPAGVHRCRAKKQTQAKTNRQPWNDEPTNASRATYSLPERFSSRWNCCANFKFSLDRVRTKLEVGSSRWLPHWGRNPCFMLPDAAISGGAVMGPCDRKES